METISGGNFKGLSPSTTPLERENLLGLLNQKYQKRAFCQYQKRIVKIIFLRIIA
jgi:hypothetical protein